MYQITHWIAKLIVQTFFKEVTIIGIERIPVSGPVIFVGNHNNKFVDASIVMATIPRKLRFLIASVSLNVRVVGRLAKMAGAIAVNRPQDMQYNGMGRIGYVGCLKEWKMPMALQNRRASSKSFDRSTTHLDDLDNLSIVIGDRQTKFHLDVKKGDRIKIQGTSMNPEVIAILDDHYMIVNAPVWQEVKLPECLDTQATSTPNGSPSRRSEHDYLPDISNIKGVLAFEVLPKVDQGDIYEAVSRALYEGDAICIFPEGGSHDQPGLLPLKPGVAIMGLNASLVGVEDVLIVPVGIHYFERHKFGSRCVVEVGEPIAIGEDLQEMYMSGKEERRLAVDRLMSIVRDGLESCTIQGPDYDTVRAIALCSQLYPPEKMKISNEKNHKIYSIFSQLFNSFKNDPKTQTIKELVLDYASHLDANGLSDHDVAQMRQHHNFEKALFLTVQKILLLLTFLLMLAPTLPVWGPLALLMNIMTEKHRREAKAKSSVKITGVDVIASYKIVWFMVMMPCIYVLAAILLSIFVFPNPPGVVLSFAISFTVLPSLTYHSLRVKSKVPALCRQIRCLYRVLISELDVWRDREREVIFDRIGVQLKVRQYIKDIIREGAMARADSSQALTTLETHLDITRQKRLSSLQTDLERLIPLVVLEADTRRLLPAKDNFIPLVYRSDLISREEIL